MDLVEVESLYYSGDTEPILEIEPQDLDSYPFAVLYKFMVINTRGNSETSENWLKIIQPLGKSDHTTVRLVYFVVVIDYYLKIRQLDNAKDMIAKALNYFHSISQPTSDEMRYFGRIIRYEGVSCVYRGDFLTGTSKFSQCLDIFTAFDDVNGMARGYFNRAASLYWLGNLEDALVDGLRGYDLIKDHSFTENYTGATNNIGLIYFSMNKPNQALKYFLMSLESSQHLGNMGYIALNYHNIIRAYLLLDDREKIRYYVSLFEELDLEVPLIRLLYSLTKGMVYLESGRVQKIAEGQKLLNQVIEGEIIDHQFTILAIYTALDYLLLELEKFQEEDILSEINDRLTKLDEIANERLIKPAMIQGNLIRSKLLMIQGDVQAALVRLKYSYDVAKELGQEALALLIDEEIALIDETSNFWSKHRPNLPLSTRIKSSNFMTLVRDIRNNQLIGKFELNESPLFFIIQRTTGMPIYTKKFGTDNNYGRVVNEFLISGFLTAVDLFGRETFSADEGIYADKLKFQENEIILRRVDDIVFSYAYRGNSRSTTKRFDILVKYITESTGLLDIIGDKSKLMDVNDISKELHLEIDRAIDNILLPQ